MSRVLTEDGIFDPWTSKLTERLEVETASLASISSRNLIRDQLERILIEKEVHAKVHDILFFGHSGELNEAQPILPNLFISSYIPAYSKSTLLSLGVTHIVSCFDEPPEFPEDFSYLVVPVEDVVQQEIQSQFDACYMFIENALMHNGSFANHDIYNKVLIHCVAGVSRSATIAISYLMRRYKLTCQDGLEVVKAARPFVEPNEGFWSQLVEFDKKLHDC